jgi:hypothetical protein
MRHTLQSARQLDTERPASGFSPQVLARLWPNRAHESNWLKSLACHFGWHRWHEIEFERSKPPQVVRFCRWCAEVRVL